MGKIFHRSPATGKHSPDLREKTRLRPEAEPSAAGAVEKAVPEPTTRKKPAFTLFILLTMWIGLEYFALGPFSYFMMHDEGDSVVARNILMMRDLREQGHTFWYPHSGGGHDRFSTDMRYTYLPVALNLFLPGWLAYQVAELLIFFFCLYFMYRFCTDVMKLSAAAGIFAGLSFTLYFHQLTTYFGYALFPFMLWSLERADRLSGARRYAAAALLGLVFAVGSSFVYTQPVTLSLVLAWFFFARKKFNPGFLALLLIIGAAIFILQDVPAMLVALKSFFPISHKAGIVTWRESGDFATAMIAKFSLRLVRNVPAFLLAVFGFITIRKKDPKARFMYLFLILCSFGVCFFELFIYFLASIGAHLPSVISSSAYMVSRFALLDHFFLGVCGAMGLDAFIRKVESDGLKPDLLRRYPPARIVKATLIISFGFLALLSIYKKGGHFLEWNKHSFYSSYYDSTTVGRLRDIRAGGGELFRVTTMGEAAGITPQYGLEETGGIVVMYSQRYKSFWSKVLEPLAKRDAFVDGDFNHYGNRIHLYRPTIDNIQDDSIIEFKKYYNLNLLSLANVKYIVSRVRMDDENLDMLPHKWKPWFEITNRTERIFTRIKEVNFQGKNRDFIYKNNGYFPRFFIAEGTVYYEDSDSLFNALAAADLETLRTTVFLEKEFKRFFTGMSPAAVAAGAGTPGRAGNISVKEYLNDSIILQVSAASDGILVAANSYSPFWQCRIDGERTPIVPAYGAFWGIPVKAGAHTVKFTYEPPYKAENLMN